MEETTQASYNPSGKRTYLLTYNTIQAILWIHILLSLALSAQPYCSIYPNIEPLALWTQTLAIADILHAAAGVTTAPVWVTTIQILSRLLHIWGVHYKFLSSTASSSGYMLMLYAWSSDNVMVYAYSALRLNGTCVPRVFKWIRYSSVFFLGPLGYVNEWRMLSDTAFCTKSEVVATVISYYRWLIYLPAGLFVHTKRIEVRQKKLYPS